MLTSQSTSQKVRGHAPLSGGGIAPVALPLSGASLAGFVRSNLSIDLRAVRAAAWSEFKLRDLQFINRYSGEPRRFWRRSCLQRRLADAMRSAEAQRHSIIHARASAQVRYTTQELSAVDRLNSRRCPLGDHAGFRQISGELQAISDAAYQRAYDAVIAKAQRGSKGRAAA